MVKMKVLFPARLNLRTFGGVATFNNTLFSYLSKKHIIYDLSFKENIIYDTLARKGILYQIKRKSTVIYDLLGFSFSKNKNKFDFVYLSPSLSRNAMVRDIGFAQKCIKQDVPFVIFFHGWDKSFEKKIAKNGYINKINKIFGKASAIWVLSSEFKNKLIEWGFSKDKIIVETTMVDNRLLDNFDINGKRKNIKIDDNLDILFLSRIIKEKGIYEAVDTFQILKETYNNIRFTIAGSGPELNKLKNYVKSKSIHDITFAGFISGQHKIDLLTKFHILFLPSYSEAMPLAVLEAMAFGMPIITRKVGGLNDFFEHGKMGYYTDSLNPQIFANYLKNLLLSRELLENMASYNYNYSQKRFLASQVVGRIENVFEQVLSERRF